jgi:hypothetical protein
MSLSSSQADGRHMKNTYASCHRTVRGSVEARVGQDTIEKLLAKDMFADVYLGLHLGQTNKQALEQSLTTSFPAPNMILFYTPDAH